MEYLSYCGILCNECPVFIATRDNDDTMKERLAAEYSSDQCSFTRKDMNCEGCFSEKNDDSKMCGNCPIRSCAKAKSAVNCGYCDAYPCGTIEGILPKDAENRQRLDRMSRTR